MAVGSVAFAAPAGSFSSDGAGELGSSPRELRCAGRTSDCSRPWPLHSCFSSAGTFRRPFHNEGPVAVGLFLVRFCGSVRVGLTVAVWFCESTCDRPATVRCGFGLAVRWFSCPAFSCPAAARLASMRCCLVKRFGTAGTTGSVADTV